MKDRISQNLALLNGQIGDACQEYDRDVDDIHILAVTKRHPISVIKTAVAVGIHNIGESRVQEADEKIKELGQIARFHMIGHLQSNKAKTAVQLFDVIQSVDSLKLAEAINRYAGEADLMVDCLIQVNCSGEPQKSGVAPEDCLELVMQVNRMQNINMTGLMTIGPHINDEATIRSAYRKCSLLFTEAREKLGADFDTLSMGMSNDFALAIAEGSTMIRVGTSLFGERPSH